MTPSDGPARPDLSTHPSVAAVLDSLAAHQVRTTVRQLPDAVRTARAAADALGVTPAEIANSLVFAGHHEDGSVEPVLVLASGGHRVDTGKVAELLGAERVERADPDTVRAATGVAIGGVPPIGHPQPLRTLVDAALAAYDAVWAAAGHPHSVFPTSHEELVRITGGSSAEVGPPIDHMG